MRMTIAEKGTVKASNFGPHGNFGPFYTSSVVFWMNHVPKMNRTEFLGLTCFYFYSLPFSVGRVSMTANPSEKDTQCFHEVQS
jgi:hypothetical protein